MNELTKGEAYSIAEFIDLNLIDAIRNNVDIDSMVWLRNIVQAYDKLAEYGGYDAGYADEKKEQSNE